MGRRKNDWCGYFPGTCELIYNGISERIRVKVDELGIPAWRILSDPSEDKFRIGDPRPKGDESPAPAIRQSMDDRYRKASGLASRIMRCKRDRDVNPYLLTRRSTELIAENLFDGDIDELVWGGRSWIKKNGRALLRAMCADIDNGDVGTGLSERMDAAKHVANRGYVGYVYAACFYERFKSGRHGNAKPCYWQIDPDALALSDEMELQYAIASVRSEKIVMRTFSDDLFEFVSGCTTKDLPLTLMEFCERRLIPAYEHANDSDRMGRIAEGVLTEAFSRIPGSLIDCLLSCDLSKNIEESGSELPDLVLRSIRTGSDFVDALEKMQNSMYQLGDLPVRIDPWDGIDPWDFEAKDALSALYGSAPAE